MHLESKCLKDATWVFNIEAASALNKDSFESFKTRILKTFDLNGYAQGEEWNVVCHRGLDGTPIETPDEFYEYLRVENHVGVKFVATDGGRDWSNSREGYKYTYLDRINSRRLQARYEEHRDAVEQHYGQGRMGFVEYFCEVEVLEPFELVGFPVDCQDIPLRIKPVNFHKLAPAYLDKDKTPFLKIPEEATNLGAFTVANTMIEFDKDAGTVDGRATDNDVRVLFKLERNWGRYLQDAFILGSVSLLSLTSYSLEEKADRLATVLGLILGMLLHFPLIVIDMMLLLPQL